MLEMKDLMDSMRDLLLPEYQKGTQMTIQGDPTDDPLNTTKQDSLDPKTKKRLKRANKSKKGKIKNGGQEKR